MTACGVSLSFCRCVKGPGHDGAHLCSCGGSWRDLDGGDVEIITFPYIFEDDS